LARLPFPSAFVVWQILNVAAMLLSIGLWRCQGSSFVACAFFPPLWSCLRLGQDTPLLLLLAVLGAILIERRREVLGGAVLALFVAKPNLVPLIPFLLLIQKRYRAVSGFLAGGVAMYLISALVMGYDWLAGYAQAVLSNEGTIWPRIPGLAELFLRAGAPRWSVYLALAAGAVLVYLCARYSEWRRSLAFTLAVAVAFAPRSMIYDLVLCLPLLLLSYTPWMVVLLGAALMTVISDRSSIIGALIAIGMTWVARPRRVES